MLDIAKWSAKNFALFDITKYLLDIVLCLYRKIEKLSGKNVN